MKLTFLGTGTSFGVPQLGCHCAVCRSPDPRDKRMRVGAVVETTGRTRILIDTPPELRLQLVSAGIDQVDAVLYTHDHADHTHGIDDLRAITKQSGPLQFYGSRETIASLSQRFGYIFDENVRPLPGTSKPEGSARVVKGGEWFTVGDASVLAVEVPHGPWSVLGYRMGRLAYVTDAKTVPEKVIEQLKGVEVLVLNALFRRPHPTHLSISEAVDVARQVGAKRTFLTHLTHENSHADLEAELLPKGITPAFDGLTVRID
jgi:phosphoribosyl 1,2-cyclic phosphate phosphodiesterase